ncbi:GntR family transcriptional regulator [Acuticoccus kandeliae]|uniref:GntR family transcriptional regulator n=1 Tax=Acuticoccus kandeliae TaxID=2073160 RepID=UPI000D3E445A|nr:GntR family transcriptional regulator [Acuticoccus kandeliae]
MTATADRQASDDPTPDDAASQKPEQVAMRIRERILEDRLRPGMPVRERVLAEALGVSRTPLREALKILAVEGLVEISPRRGATVAAPSREEQRELLQFLGAIEGFAGVLACDTVTPADLAQLRAMHEAMVASIGEGDRLAYFHHNQAIHQRIVALTGNAVLAMQHAQVNVRAYRLRYVSNLKTERWGSAIAEHEAILTALEAGDKPAIRTILENHVLAAFDQMVREGTDDDVPETPARPRPKASGKG